IHNQTAPSTGAINRYTREGINEPIYWATVPSGDFLTRKNGKISVSGNSLNYNFGFKSFARLYEIPEDQAKFICDRCRAVYEMEVYYNWVKEQLRKNRTLTNLFGRKIRLLDRWGDDLFKQGYA